MCAITYLYSRHYAIMCVLWPMSLFSLLMVAMVRAPWLIHTCAMTHPYVCHNSSVPWLIHTCAISHSCVWHDSFMYVPWLITMCATTHSYLCHDSYMCVPWRMTFIHEPWLLHVCAMTHAPISVLLVTRMYSLVFAFEKYVLENKWNQFCVGLFHRVPYREQENTFYV